MSATVVIRNIPEQVLSAIESNAATRGVSREAYLRQLLTIAADADPIDRKLDNLTNMVRSLYYAQQSTEVSDIADT